MTLRRCTVAAALILSMLASAALPGSRAGAADPIVINIGTLPTDPTAEPFYAQDMGFFKAAGLDVHVTVLQNGASLASAILSGALDIAGTTVGVVALAHEHNVPIRLIAPAAMYTGKNRTSALMVVQDSPIHTGADLTGKTVGVAGLKDMSQFSTCAWINQNGGDYRTVHFVEIPFPQMNAALQTGRIDAAVLAEPFMFQARSFARELGNQQAAVGERYVSAGFIAREDWVKQNPDAARRLIEALQKTATWANAHPSESADILMRYTKIPPELLKSMGRTEYFPGKLDAASIQPVVDAAAKYGTLTHSFPASELISTGL